MIRTVKLEIVRHGPSHNQLLSPLTSYLALCGNHDAETVHVGTEHRPFMRRMGAVRSSLRDELGRLSFQEITEEVSRFAASMHSLAAELTAASRNGGHGMIHLRVALSASELSLIPFEMIRSPAGFPGPGQWLSLQPVAPVSITREIRRVPATTISWPKAPPRVLLISASPPGFDPVPVDSHVLALRMALGPWLPSNKVTDVAEQLTVVDCATLSKVRAAGARGPFTHVHVLAHGAPLHEDGPEGVKYGLALCSDDYPGEAQVVNGTELAAALRCHLDRRWSPGLASPVVVTVASCDSANVGNVIAPDASVAHELHEAGVPLVIASQFPLTMKGSVIMAELIYERLFHGEDPRVLVHELRQKLHVDSKDSHDWAAIVAYAALPEDFDQQVVAARVQQGRSAINATIRRSEQKSRSGDPLPQKAIDTLTALTARSDLSPETRSLAYGALASARKCEADVERRSAANLAGPGHCLAENEVAKKKLRESRDLYLKAFRADANQSWALVQSLALEAFEAAGKPSSETFPAQWQTARLLAEQSMRLNGRAGIWAHAALIELWVLAQLLPSNERDLAAFEAERLLDNFFLLCNPKNLDAYSLFRQLDRYSHWWQSASTAALPRKLAQRLTNNGTPTEWSLDIEMT